MDFLNEFQLRVMGIPATGMKKLAKNFSKFPNLKVFNLLYNNIDFVEEGKNDILGSEILAQNLFQLKNLVWFSIYGNYINSNGIKVVVDSLAENCRCLEKAIFGRNHFDGETINYTLSKLLYSLK